MSLALLFSPQGSQAVGMGRALADASAAARETFAIADATLGWSVSGTCWEGPAERLNDTRQTQPCLLTSSVAALRALQERGGVTPALAAGHSVGEYAALVAAGVLELPAALRLVARRGELMAAADAAGGMAAVLGLDRAAVEEIVAATARPTELVVANDNAPGQVVISGAMAAIGAAEAALKAAGARRVLRLPVSGAFHSPLMADVAEALADAFGGETWHDAGFPVVSNVTAEPITDATRIRALLAEQVRSPVEWVRSVERMVADGVDRMVECGPGGALVGMVKRIAPGIAAVAAGEPDGVAAAAELVAGAEASA
ncbi:MAG TPA: ACP S-malonyltransferase [Candidatus Limnocylindria bacterium]|nr:ACP S-malonyltransferase [Candidatus Limnocylindria bacterium]